MSGAGSFRSWLSRIESRNPRSWLIGLIVALLGWQVGFETPTRGLDQSWWAGLYMAAHDGMRFGEDIVFTYGPLGILRTPWLFYSGTLSLIPYLYGAVIFSAFSIALIAILRRRIGWFPAALVALALLLFLKQTELSVGLAMFASILIIERRPSSRGLLTFAVAGGLLAGIETLGKLSVGPVIVVVLLLGLTGARARFRDVAVYLLTLIATAVGLWLITGQSIGDLPGFIVNSVQIVSGYSEAMTLYDQPSQIANLLFVVLTAIATVVWTLSGRYQDRRADLAAGAIALVITFAFYKQAVIRIDGIHMAAYFALIALLWVAIPPRRGLLVVSLAGFAALAVTATLYSNSESPGPGHNPITNLGDFVSEGRTALSPGRQRREMAAARSDLQDEYGIEPRLLDEIGDRPVSVEPWETMAAWAYGLNWSPVPVFQNYSAYTTRLDEINSDRINSPDGPEVILRHTGRFKRFPQRGIDSRLMAWDPPAQAVATLCNFESAGIADDWQVLTRVPDRCGPLKPAGVVDASFGEPVKVPPPGAGQIVLVRIEGAEVRGLERLRSLLFRPGQRLAQTDRMVYRLIPATATDGLMLRGGPGVTETRGKFAQVPDISSLELTGGRGELSYEFFRMSLREGRAAQILTSP